MEIPQPYRYDPINVARNEIRLLTLHPGAFDDTIIVSLNSVPFTEDEVPAFEALSYVWGSLEDPGTIFVDNGQSYQNVLSISRNLAIALPYLRFTEKPRVLWIDAICVNPRDLNERSQQVTRMADIYSNAERVIAWLGPSYEGFLLALKCFNNIAAKIHVDWAKQDIRLSNDLSLGVQVAIEMVAYIGRNEREAIAQFFDFEWFERLWIVQEIQLASEGMATVQCGTEQILWTDFGKATFFFYITSGLLDLETITFEKLAHRLDMVYRLARDGGNRQSLTSLLENTKLRKCTDPQDRIYALLSLLDKSVSRSGIAPDYSKSVPEVFADVTKRIIVDYGHSSILGTVEMYKEIERMPSWTIDWSGLKQSTSLPALLAGGWSKVAANLLSKSVLRFWGSVVDPIEVVEPFRFPFAPYSEDIALEIKRVFSCLDLKVHDTLELARVLGANTYAENFAPLRDSYPKLSIGGAQIALILEHDDLGKVGVLDDPYWKKFEHYSGHRSLYKTRNGHIGIGPEAARPGDIVTVLLGCRNPFILRPSHENHFKIVGETYCAGFMYGEALLGPVPDEFEMVGKWHREDKTYKLIFRNTVTKTFQTLDPRLDNIPLPSGWDVRSHTNPELKWFKNTMNGEKMNWYQDPRLTVKELKVRGVDIRTFDLI